MKERAEARTQEMLAWPAAQWYGHDIAQTTALLRSVDDQLAQARADLRDAHLQWQLTGAPDWVDGPHTEAERQAAYAREGAADNFVMKLEMQREALIEQLAELKREQAAEQRQRAIDASRERSPATLTLMPARTASRPRERRERRVRRASSSTDDSGSSEPPGLTGRRSRQVAA